MTAADRAAWRTSSYSSNGEACVEVALAGSGAMLRDSKSPMSGTLTVCRAAWSDFVYRARR